MDAWFETLNWSAILLLRLLKHALLMLTEKIIILVLLEYFWTILIAASVAKLVYMAKGPGSMITPNGVGSSNALQGPLQDLTIHMDGALWAHKLLECHHKMFPQCPNPCKVWVKCKQGQIFEKFRHLFKCDDISHLKLVEGLCTQLGVIVMSN